MRDDLSAGTVTFLFTDVEGSTRLLNGLGAEGYAKALADHRRAIREACVAEGGVEVDTQGDAFFFAFPTAPGALDAAEAITEPLASGPIQVHQLIAYQPIVFQGRDAIYWEFLVREDGRLLRKVDIFFVDSFGNGYGLLTQAPADKWDSWSSRMAQLRESLAIYGD